LKEGLSLVDERLEDVVEPVSDLLTDSGELNGIIISGSIEFSAVTTVIAVGSDGDLVPLGHALCLCGPLPWVLVSVGKEGVGAGNVPATLVSLRLPRLGSVVHVQALEGALAHVWPELCSQEL